MLETMPGAPRPHLVSELCDRTIRGLYPGQVKKAQKSLFAWSFKCYRDDEYEGIAVELEENVPQSGVEPPIYACKFGEGKNYGHILVLANEDGQIGLRDTRLVGSVSPVEGQQIHQNAIFDVCWVPGSAELVSVSGDQCVSILAVREDGTLDVTLSLLGHTRSVKTVHVNPYDPCVIATGARDGSVIIWDKRCKPHHKADEIAPAHSNLGKTIASPSVRKAAMASSSLNNSVTGVVFQQQHVVISSGASDGLIKLWDLRKTHGGGKREPQCQNILEHTGRSSHRGFTSLSVSPSRDVLYTSCMDNTIYAYHLANPTPKPGMFHVNIHKMTKLYYYIYILKVSVSVVNPGALNLCWYERRTMKRLIFEHLSFMVEYKVVTCADDMKLRIFRRKNVDLDDFDEKINIRGISEPYIIKERNSECATDNKTAIYLGNKERTVSESHEPLPSLPVTPSTSRTRASLAATPNTRKREGQCNADSPQTHPSTPRQQTPRRKQGTKGRATPCTPKTSDRNTLLTWLATAKTPGSQDSASTSGITVVSDSKKASLKRKLTDIIGEDQENIQDEVKPKSPNSPKKSILGILPSVNNSLSPQPSVAKMLKYGDDVGSSILQKCKEKGEGVTEMTECMKPIEALGVGFRKPVTNVASKLMEKSGHYIESKENLHKDSTLTQLPEPYINVQTVSSKTSFRIGNLSSPTANLPNYIVDGLSPHNRPETRVQKKRNTDWLTSFSHQRKLKFTRTPDKVIRNIVPSGSSGPHKQKDRKILKIKQKKSAAP
nr:denticleless protein homolog [Procambarus clarkii]